MAECKMCQKTLNREASEIGSWCIDCIKEMSDTNTSNMEAKRDSIKNEKLIIIICAAIGAVVGIIIGPSIAGGSEIAIAIICSTWIFGGLGVGLGYFIKGFALGIKYYMAEGKSLGEALKYVLFQGVFFLVLGFFTSVLLFLFLILRRNNWIKKFDAIIASENAAIAELEDYIHGKEINKPDLSRKIKIIAANFELAHDGVSLNDLKQLKIVQ